MYPNLFVDYTTYLDDQPQTFCMESIACLLTEMHFGVIAAHRLGRRE